MESRNFNIFQKLGYICPLQSTRAGVVKLVDTLDLGSSASRRGGSSPFTRTPKTSTVVGVFLFPSLFFYKNTISQVFSQRTLIYTKSF